MKNQKKTIIKKKSLKVIDLVLFNIDNNENEILAFDLKKQNN